MSTSPSSQFETDYSPSPSLAGEIDDSLRWPVLYLFLAAAFWLFVGTGLATISSLQLHLPEFMAGCPWMTHGKCTPAAWNTLLYGFAVQAMAATVVYLICRLSRKAMRHGITLHVCGKFWNLGVLLGIIGIFIGDSSGHRFLEFPGYATGVLVASLVFVVLKSLMTLHFRADREMYPSQWFAGAGLLWLVWVMCTGVVLLQWRPVAGVAQLVVNGWYVNGLFQVVLTSGGLAALFYFLPQMVDRPLHSRELAVTAFWLIMLLGGWTGLAGRWPLPAWISSVSAAVGFLMLVPVVLVLLNLLMTVHWDFSKLWEETSFRFFIGGMTCYGLWSVCGVAYGIPSVFERLQFTHYLTGQQYLFLYGFCGMVFAGVMAKIGPGLSGIECECRGARVALYVLSAGIVATVLPLSLAGAAQGGVLNNASLPFVDSVTGTSGMLKLASLGNLLLLGASAMMLLGAGRLFVGIVNQQFPVRDWCGEEDAGAEVVTAEGGAK